MAFTAFLIFSVVVKIIESRIQTPGLYYDHIENVRLTSNSLQLTTYIDVDDLLNFLPNILPLRYFDADLGGGGNYTKEDPGLAGLHKICQKYEADKIVENNCDFVSRRLPFLEQQRKKIAMYTEQINSLFHKDVIKTKRNEPIYPIVGAISSSLFGILNKDDAKMINEEINKLKRDNKKTISVLNNTTHLLQTELHTVQTRLKNNDGLINYFRAQMEEFSVGWKSKDTLLWKVHFETMVNLGRTWLQNIELSYDEYINSLKLVIQIDYFARLGLIHPRIMSSKKIEDSLRLFLQNNNNQYVLPLSINEAGIDGLRKIAKISITYHERRILLSIMIPLLSPKIYSIYEIHPAPIKQHTFQSHIAAYIKPKSSLILIAQDKSEYSTNVNIQACQFSPVVPTSFCTHSFSLQDTRNINSCEINLLMTNKQDNMLDCDIQFYENPQLNFIQLYNKKWLYSMVENTELRVICGDDVKTRKLNYTGIITVNSGCRARIDYVTLVGVPGISQNIDKVLHPYIGGYDFLNLVEGINETNKTAIEKMIVNSSPLSLKEIVKTLNAVKFTVTEKEKIHATHLKILLGQILLGLVLLYHILKKPTLNCFYTIRKKN